MKSKDLIALLETLGPDAEITYPVNTETVDGVGFIALPLELQILETPSKFYHDTLVADDGGSIPVHCICAK